MDLPGSFVRVQGVSGRLTILPRWGRWLVFVAAVPGLCLLALSLLAVAVSIAALLLLAGPVFWVVFRLTGAGPGNSVPEAPGNWGGPGEHPGSRRVDATVVEDGAVDDVPPESR